MSYPTPNEPRQPTPVQSAVCRRPCPGVAALIVSSCTGSMDKIRNLALVLMVATAAGCDKYKADLTRGMPSTCEIHRTEMLKTNVPIEYGLIRLNDFGRARQAASTSSFPHAQESVLGGCIVGTATQAIIYICPDCQKALQKWELARESVKPKS